MRFINNLNNLIIKQLPLHIHHTFLEKKWTIHKIKETEKCLEDKQS